MKLTSALSWDELANEYQKCTGRIARIQPMDSVFEWAENQKDKFIVCPVEGTIHKIKKQKENNL